MTLDLILETAPATLILLEQDAADWLILEQEVAEEVVARGGGADYRRKRRKQPEPDLFKEMEKTIYELIHPQEPVEAIAEAVTAPPSTETLDEKLNDLLDLAGESHALLQRAAQVRADVQALAEARYRRMLDDDDEEAVVWMA